MLTNGTYSLPKPLTGNWRAFTELRGWDTGGTKTVISLVSFTIWNTSKWISNMWNSFKTPHCSNILTANEYSSWLCGWCCSQGITNSYKDFCEGWKKMKSLKIILMSVQSHWETCFFQSYCKIPTGKHRQCPLTFIQGKYFWTLQNTQHFWNTTTIETHTLTII